MDIEINGIAYQTHQLNAMKQFHIMRRIAPLLQGFLAAPNPEAFFGAVTEAISKIPEADCDYVMHTCLAAVTRYSGDRWAPVFARQTIVFDDIDLAGLLKLVSTVITENLSGFFRGGVAKLVPAAAATKTA